MSSTISSWFTKVSNTKKEEEENSTTDENNTEEKEVVKETNAKQKETCENSEDIIPAEVVEKTQKLMKSAFSFGNYLLEVASETTKKVSSNLNETATNLKKTVEEKESLLRSKEILSETLLGDLNKEQNEFIRNKKSFGDDGAVPVWCGYQEEEEMKKQIMQLSMESRNFLRSPPSGIPFNFEMDHYFPTAIATLKEDKNLRKMRFALVPTKIKEELFWRNYFYRVSLIKQTLQLHTIQQTSSKPQQVVNNSDTSCDSSIVVVSGNSPNNNQANAPNDNLIADEVEDSHNACDINEDAEFESDAFSNPMTEGMNAEELEREMRQLGVTDEEFAAGNENNKDWEPPEWEKEIQKALQAYEVVDEKEVDTELDAEIEDMLSKVDEPKQ